jgi:hypothetical protein
MPSSRSGLAGRMSPQDLLARQIDAWRALMTASGPPEAKVYAHKHRYCGYGLHYDYTHSNALSPDSYIYPAANWGPFFQCHMYYGQSTSRSPIRPDASLKLRAAAIQTAAVLFRLVVLTPCSDFFFRLLFATWGRQDRRLWRYFSLRSRQTTRPKVCTRC